MSDTLSSDLASLKIDRDARPSGGGPVRLAGIVLMLAGLAFFGYQKAKPYVEAEFFKTEVEVTEIPLVSPAQASVELHLDAATSCRRCARKVGAKGPGRVAKVLVREGDHVKAGQLLARARARRSSRGDAVGDACVRRRRGRAWSRHARTSTRSPSKRERQKALAERGAAPAAQADDLGLARARRSASRSTPLEAEVAAADAEVEALRVSFGNHDVIAPIDGTRAQQAARGRRAGRPRARSGQRHHRARRFLVDLWSRPTCPRRACTW